MLTLHALMSTAEEEKCCWQSSTLAKSLYLNAGLLDPIDEAAM